MATGVIKATLGYCKDAIRGHFNRTDFPTAMLDMALDQGRREIEEEAKRRLAAGEEFPPTERPANQPVVSTNAEDSRPDTVAEGMEGSNPLDQITMDELFQLG